MISGSPLHAIQECPTAGRLASLRRWRSARGLSQAQLAETAGLTQAAISELERGHRVPSLRTVAKLAVALEVSLSDLVQAKAPETLSREVADRIASYIIQGEGRIPAAERRIAGDLAGLVIQKLRAHRVPGSRRVARCRWAAAGRAMWVKGIYGGHLPEQVLRRLDVLLTVRGAG